MKKIIIAGSFIMISLIASAQRSKTEFGIKGGLNVADLSAAGYQTRTSAHVGMLAHIHMNRQWAVQPELLFSGQGARRLIGNDEIVTKLNYISLPIVLQYMFDNGFRLQTGPQFSGLVSARSSSKGVSVDVGDSFNAPDVSWVFGVGYISSQNVGVDVRFNPGITDIAKGGADIKNNVFQLGVFYQFKHK